MGYKSHCNRVFSSVSHFQSIWECSHVPFPTKRSVLGVPLMLMFLFYGNNFYLLEEKLTPNCPGPASTRGPSMFPAPEVSNSVNTALLKNNSSLIIHGHLPPESLPTSLSPRARTGTSPQGLSALPSACAKLPEHVLVQKGVFKPCFLAQG